MSNNTTPWDVRDPEALIAEVLRRQRPQPGDVLVAQLGRGDDPDQAVVDVVRVHRGARPPRLDASEMLATHALTVVGDRSRKGKGWTPPQYLLVTIVCRSGRVVPGPEESSWLMAWRYSNHNSNAFDGDVYLVTEHGWTGCCDERAGFAPALPRAGRRLSVAQG